MICTTAWNERHTRPSGIVGLGAADPRGLSLDSAPSDFHFFTSLGLALATPFRAALQFLRIRLENARRFAMKNGNFLRCVQKLPEKWEQHIGSDGTHFEDLI